MLQTEPQLDELFHSQEAVVKEARQRMAQYCPEWSDAPRASDPGMALIKIFSWMTEETVSRLNQVPEKNHRQFLELLGIQLKPASSARTELTFYLSTDLPIDPKNKFDETYALVPQGTEVTTLYTEDDEEEVIFTTDKLLKIQKPPRLDFLFREGDPKNYMNEGQVVGQLVKVFQPERATDAFCLGFQASPDVDMSGYILRLSFTCEKAEGTGMKPKAPPWLWECFADEKWEEVQLGTRPKEEDTTGGLNYPKGSLVLYLPLTVKPSQVNGQLAYWLRCTHKPVEGNRYKESPKVMSIQPYTLGATTRATHRLFTRDEELGFSNGEASQQFRLIHSPILEPIPEKKETLEVQERQYNELTFVPWQRVKDFARSTKDDRHFTLDPIPGEIRFGPAIRQSDGSVKQYGRIPERGARIRFSQYRRGGGREGDLASGQLEVLKTTLPYINEVINWLPSTGGRPQETLTEAKKRARQEMRAQERAVTASDYENLVLGASRQIVRVRCLTPREDQNLSAGHIRLLLVPEATNAVRQRDWAGLRLDAPLREKIEKHLVNYQLPTMRPHISEPRYVGVRVDCQVVPSPRSTRAPELLKKNINDALTAFLTPLPLAPPLSPPTLGGKRGGGSYLGWPFGGYLYKGELMRLVEKLPGVRYVSQMQLRSRELSLNARIKRAQRADSADNQPTDTEENLITSMNDWVIEIPIDALICSLEHQIDIVES